MARYGWMSSAYHPPALTHPSQTVTHSSFQPQKINPSPFPPFHVPLLTHPTSSVTHESIYFHPLTHLPNSSPFSSISLISSSIFIHPTFSFTRKSSPSSIYTHPSTLAHPSFHLLIHFLPFLIHFHSSNLLIHPRTVSFIHLYSSTCS